MENADKCFEWKIWVNIRLCNYDKEISGDNTVNIVMLGFSDEDMKPVTIPTPAIKYEKIHGITIKEARRRFREESAKIKADFEIRLKKYYKKRDNYVFDYIAHRMWVSVKKWLKTPVEKRRECEKGRVPLYPSRLIRKKLNIGKGELEHWLEDDEDVEDFEKGEYTEEEEKFFYSVGLQVVPLDKYWCFLDRHKIFDKEYVIKLLRAPLDINWLLKTRSRYFQQTIAFYGVREGERMIREYMIVEEVFDVWRMINHWGPRRFRLF